jgi:hypothetical protein
LEQIRAGAAAAAVEWTSAVARDDTARGVAAHGVHFSGVRFIQARRCHRRTAPGHKTSVAATVGDKSGAWMSTELQKSTNR